MSKRPWTEGPWSWCDNDGHSVCNIYAPGSQSPIAEVHGDSAEAEANACLITAAPALYEALAGAVKILTILYHAPLNNTAIEEMTAALRAANPDAFDSTGSEGGS